MRVNSIKFIGILIVSTWITGCIYVETGSSARSLEVAVKKGSVLTVKFGEKEFINSLDSTDLYRLMFDFLLGGVTKFFGIFDIKESNPNEITRLKVASSDDQIFEYRIDELLKLDTIIIDSSVIY